MCNSSYSEILQKLKEICIAKSLRQGMLAGHICRLLSPYCSALFIKRSFTPNQVTLLMILFGIIGSVFFMISNCWCKLVGYIFWYLWFTMDLSDGEVARYTKIFSKYGVEMDFMAHLIDHPLMNIAIWLTFLSFNIIDPMILSLVFIVTISIELITRNIITFQHFHKKIANSPQPPVEQSLIKYFLTQALLYPNFIIIFTPLIVIDCFLGNGFSLYLYLAWFAYLTLSFLRMIIKQVILFYRGH